MMMMMMDSGGGGCGGCSRVPSFFTKTSHLQSLKNKKKEKKPTKAK
jgi:hypothetical protein